MEIKDLQSNQGNIDLILTIREKGEVRSFEKFGKTGRVCNLVAEDGSGEVKFTLWNEDIDKVDTGDKIHLKNGWCSEFRGEKQLSTGKFGEIEILEKAPAAAIVSNSDKIVESFSSSPLEQSGEAGEEPIGEEELIE